jgi:hypothetical protein
MDYTCLYVNVDVCKCPKYFYVLFFINKKEKEKRKRERYDYQTTTILTSTSDKSEHNDQNLHSFFFLSATFNINNHTKKKERVTILHQTFFLFLFSSLQINNSLKKNNFFLFPFIPKKSMKNKQSTMKNSALFIFI